MIVARNQAGQFIGKEGLRQTLSHNPLLNACPLQRVSDQLSVLFQFRRLDDCHADG